MESATGQLTSHGMSDADRDFFLENGCLHVRKVLDGSHLVRLQGDFERIWALEQPPVKQHKLLRHQTFIDLIEHPPILDLHRSIFGNQVELLQFDLLRQGPHSTAPEQAWHRDFSFPGERPLAVNTILYLDDMSEETGPTRIVPGSHRGT